VDGRTVSGRVGHRDGGRTTLGTYAYFQAAQDRTAAELMEGLIRAFAIETAAFPPALAWSAPLLVDSFTTAASLVICATCAGRLASALVCLELGRLCHSVSVALDVAHAPDRLAAQLFAALPPVALLGALELLMSVPTPACRTPTAEDRSSEHEDTAALVGRPQLPAPDHAAAAGNGSGPQRDSRTRVRELVARERATGIRLHARDVAAAAGISERRAYELLRAVRAEGNQP
jgi:hypothetical protein